MQPDGGTDTVAPQPTLTDQGQSISETPVMEDYFGFSESHTWYFPDGIQYLEYQVMNEGSKKEYQSKSNRKITLRRTTGDAMMDVDAGEERHSLLESATVGWKLFRDGKELPFTKGNFRLWLSYANPRLVEEFEKEVRKANPWLMQEMSVADIDKELENLKEMREIAVERERGN